MSSLVTLFAICFFRFSLSERLITRYNASVEVINTIFPNLINITCKCLFLFGIIAYLHNDFVNSVEFLLIVPRYDYLLFVCVKIILIAIPPNNKKCTKFR